MQPFQNTIPSKYKISLHYQSWGFPLMCSTSFHRIPFFGLEFPLSLRNRNSTQGIKQNESLLILSCAKLWSRDKKETLCCLKKQTKKAPQILFCDTAFNVPGHQVMIKGGCQSFSPCMYTAQDQEEGQAHSFSGRFLEAVHTTSP